MDIIIEQSELKQMVINNVGKEINRQLSEDQIEFIVEKGPAGLLHISIKITIS